MTILHTADLHLRNTSDHRWDALGTVLDKAAEVAADVVVIAGDLFDRDVDAQQLKTALRSLFESRGLLVLLLPGNHDQRGLRPGDFYGERVTLLCDAEDPVDVGDVRFVALPFSDGGVEQTIERLRAAGERCDPGKTNALVYHGELLDLVPGGGAFGDEESDYMPARQASFAGLGFDYVLAGHFHRGYAVHRFDGGYFIYPGSPVSITVKETGRRHANVVVPGAPPRAEPLDTFHVESVDVRLDPLDGRYPIDVIDESLRGLHPKAQAMLTVEGFVNLGAVGMTETEFHAAIKKEIARWPVKEIDARWTDVRDVVENDLFRKFVARTKGSVDPEHRAEMQDLVIRSLMETMYAR
jgi:exonuclease SbcD